MGIFTHVVVGTNDVERGRKFYDAVLGALMQAVPHIVPAGGAPGAPATYVGMCHIFCDSVQSFQAGMGPHMAEIMGDIQNYTDIAPVMQISEVVVGKA